MIDKLERDVKQAQDVIDKKKTRSCEVISANKGLYSQIIAAKIKPKATSRAWSPVNLSTSWIASSVKSSQTDSHHEIPYKIPSQNKLLFHILSSSWWRLNEFYFKYKSMFVQ